MDAKRAGLFIAHAVKKLGRLNGLTADELDIVSERLLTVGSIAEVFSGLGK